MSNINDLQTLLGVKFNKIALLEEALTHPSYSNEHPGCPHNQRLEFLGDAVLELAMSTFLYKKYQDLNEGQMTKKRAQSVCTEALATFANKIKLGDYLRLGNGEEANGGRNREALLEDAFEAMLGAIYEDQGFEAANDVFKRIVVPNMPDVLFIKDYKTTLQEYVRVDKKTLEYEIVNETGPSHDKVFEAVVYMDNKTVTLGYGSGKTKKEAEQNAAKMALEKLSCPDI